jgi:hypothetical protein
MCTDAFYHPVYTTLCSEIPSYSPYPMHSSLYLDALSLTLALFCVPALEAGIFPEKELVILCPGTQLHLPRILMARLQHYRILRCIDLFIVYFLCLERSCIVFVSGQNGV